VRGWGNADEGMWQANTGLIEAPVFYFFIATTGDLDPRTIGDKDQRLKPMNVDPVSEAPQQIAI
jgi:hypothetical protein